MEKSLQAKLHSHFEKTPDRRAVAFYDNRNEYAWYTYGQLHQRAAGYAARLADHGLKRGDVCLLVLESGEFSGMLILASLLLGAVPLLMAPPVVDAPHSSLKEILEHLIGKTKPRIVVCSKSMASMDDGLQGHRRTTRILFGEGDLAPVAGAVIAPVLPAESDIAAMQLTSGTTGFPRVCVWSQRSVVAALKGNALGVGLRDDDVCLNWTPLYHDMGLVNNFLCCLYSGVPIVMQSPHAFVRTPALWLRGLAETGATTTWAPNFGFALAVQRIRDDEMAGVRLDGVRAFWNAAERIHYRTMLAFHERFAPFGVRMDALKTNFGCAENIGGATFSDPDGMFVVEWVDREALFEEGIARPVTAQEDEARSVPVVSCGRPYPGMRIQILSGDEQPLPEGHVGEVAFETPSRMNGYLEDALETERAILGPLLRTGDLGYVRNGEFFWVGRTRERITVRGRKLDPSVFESILTQVPGLRQGCFAAFGTDDEVRGTERVVLVAEVRDAAAEDRKEIPGAIRRLTLLQLGVNIDDILLVRPGTLTKTSSGKRRHLHFRRLYMEGKLKEFAVSDSAA